jgi:hypothetical protein
MMSRRAAGAGLAALIMFLMCTIPARAQTTPPPRRDTFWVGVGLGAGSEDFAGTLNGSYQFGGNLLSLRASATAGLFDDGFGDYALLYGRATPPAGKRYHASAALGLAIVQGCEGGGLGGCRNVSDVVGVPIELQLFWRPGSLVGLGLYGFANFNEQRSFAGMTLGLQLGRLR